MQSKATSHSRSYNYSCLGEIILLDEKTAQRKVELAWAENR